MFRILFCAVWLICVQTSQAQQSNVWSPYFENEQIRISTQLTDCHYPEKGVHNKYLQVRIENITTSELTLSYNLLRSYNGNPVKADTDFFEFVIPSNTSLQSECGQLIKGLYLFASMIEPKTKSKLTGFELSNLSVNGKTVK